MGQSEDQLRSYLKDKNNKTSKTLSIMSCPMCHLPDVTLAEKENPKDPDVYQCINCNENIVPNVMKAKYYLERFKKLKRLYQGIGVTERVKADVGKLP